MTGTMIDFDHAATTRLREEALAAMIARVIREGEAAIPQVKEQVLALCARFPLYGDCVRA